MSGRGRAPEVGGTPEPPGGVAPAARGARGTERPPAPNPDPWVPAQADRRSVDPREPQLTPSPGRIGDSGSRVPASPLLRAGFVGGELMMTAGAVVMLFIGYQLWVTGLFQARDQERLHDELARTWSAAVPSAPASGDTTVGDLSAVPPPAPAKPGEALAVLHVPAFGADYAPVVIEGVSTENLKLGPGHYPGTALPGEVGNFVVSGHRTTYGAPFARLDELKAGAPIVVELQDRYYTYRVTRSDVVSPDRVDVTFPVPSEPHVAPTKALMTFTTCHPKFSAASRLIVFAELAATTPKGSEPPPELAGG